MWYYNVLVCIYNGDMNICYMVHMICITNRTWVTSEIPHYTQGKNKIWNTQGYQKDNIYAEYLQTWWKQDATNVRIYTACEIKCSSN
jgi:hypothetical protein